MGLMQANGTAQTGRQSCGGYLTSILRANRGFYGNELRAAQRVVVTAVRGVLLWQEG